MMTIKINLNFLNMSNHWIMLNVSMEWEEAAIEAIDQGYDICWIDRYPTLRSALMTPRRQ